MNSSASSNTNDQNENKNTKHSLSKTNRLLHGAVGSLHLLQSATMIGLLAKENKYKWPITNPSMLDVNQLGTYDMKNLLPIPSALSALNHFTTVAMNKSRPEIQWGEYAISSGIMLWIISNLSGLIDIKSLVTIILLNVLLQRTGIYLENHRNDKAAVMNNLLIGFVLHAIIWYHIIHAFNNTLKNTEKKSGVKPPEIVSYIIYIMGALFSSFGVCCAMDMLGDNEDKNETIERVYITLSLLSKSALNWMIYFGVIKGSPEFHNEFNGYELIYENTIGFNAAKGPLKGTIIQEDYWTSQLVQFENDNDINVGVRLKWSPNRILMFNSNSSDSPDFYIMQGLEPDNLPTEAHGVLRINNIDEEGVTYSHPKVEFIVQNNRSVRIESVIIGLSENFNIDNSKVSDDIEPHTFTLKILKSGSDKIVFKHKTENLGKGDFETVKFDFYGENGQSYNLVFQSNGIKPHSYAAIDNLKFSVMGMVSKNTN